MNKLIIDQRKFNGLVSNICRSITNDSWRPDYIVGITRGGLLPAVMISHWLNVPMQSLDVSLRDNSLCVSNLGMAEDAFGYVSVEDREFTEGEHAAVEARKNILIVDDINDTGATFNWIMKDWPSGCFPDDDPWQSVWGNNVRFAVVVDNLSSNCDVKMNYCGMEINKAENNVWIEFPYEEWWSK
jgi:xanthine phosphoribosyltransferase